MYEGKGVCFCGSVRLICGGLIALVFVVCCAALTNGQVFDNGENGIENGQRLWKRGQLSNMPPWVKWALTTPRPLPEPIPQLQDLALLQDGGSQEPSSMTLPCYLHPVSCFGRQSNFARMG